MVKIKENSQWLSETGINVEQWLSEIGQHGKVKDLNFIRHACALIQLSNTHHTTETGMSCLEQGVMMADMLMDLHLSDESIVAGLIYPTVHHADLSLHDVTEQLGEPIAKLVKGVERMSGLSTLQTLHPKTSKQLDNIRKMLLSMVDDVRIVLIKLTERLCALRSASQLPKPMQLRLASDIMEIYAPLANRLGIGAMKWEMEDLAFRYLEPDAYQEIAKGLKVKRIERDQYVNDIVTLLKEALEKAGIQGTMVYGRSKHIHSIYKKMKRKHVPLEHIYDTTAIRVMVNTKEDCYAVLSLVHSLWQPIPAEFDDYITKPKANGYQSLHTAVLGPLERIFEVQIRTYDMDALAEMGVAAHWKYKDKEGAEALRESHDRKIDWLREVLAWHREMSKQDDEHAVLEQAFLEDRVYVLTPQGDILDLPKGVTPLDFAYHVHTQLGHRCRGAKVNACMVPITTILQTGDKVEILTGKVEKPSRDWLSPHSHYLKTARAKAKVLHWFKMQDYDLHVDQGRALLDKESKSLGLKIEHLKQIAMELNYKTEDDLLAALGRGELKIAQVIHALPDAGALEQSMPSLPRVSHQVKPVGDDVKVEGVGQLLTSMAKCCQPLPGDEVIGYVTIGRGVSIHRKDCPNILHSTKKQRQRFLQVGWGKPTQEHYLVDISITAFDRVDLLRDITNLLAVERAHVHALRTDSDKRENLIWIKLTIDVDGLSGLLRLLAKLGQIQNVLEVKRQVS